MQNTHLIGPKLRYIIGGLFVYHTYCGFKLNKYDTSTQQEKLKIDRVMGATCNGLLSVFPMGFVSIINDFNRLEVYILNRDPNNFPIIYNEVLYDYKK